MTPPLKREVFWQEFEMDWKEFSCGRSKDFRAQLLRESVRNFTHQTLAKELHVQGEMS